MLTDLPGQVSQPSRCPRCVAQVRLSGCPVSLPFSLSRPPLPSHLSAFPPFQPPASFSSLTGGSEPLLLQGDAGKPWLQTSAIRIFPAPPEMEFMSKAPPAPPSGSLGGTPSRRRGRGLASPRHRTRGSICPSCGWWGDSVQSRAGEAFDVEPTLVLGLRNTVTLEAATDAPLPWAQWRSGEGTPGGGARLRPRQPAAVTHGGAHSCFLSPLSRATHWRWEMRLQFGAQRDQLRSSGSKRTDQGERY